MDEHSFDELVGDLEVEFNAARLEKRGAYAVVAAKIAGAVYLEAIAAGVPHVLAQEMAQDYWATEVEGPAVLVTEVDDTE
ncbi:hypothetical protein H9W91_07095 [Streptomyces alfalfae]|uniref:hypothetical protein n=1 Tax=Streptomyces alfalfae TaxID=1642299 RepID=UPI001BAA4500|nr:hypothetical protein [Streptomyces alfalfae]QUI30654.1 hypothetical protein H9W91_07095 [Streptomyces alfalfae]